jgi:hypothetical protein
VSTAGSWSSAPACGSPASPRPDPISSSSPAARPTRSAPVAYAPRGARPRRGAATQVFRRIALRARPHARPPVPPQHPDRRPPTRGASPSRDAAARAALHPALG